LIAARIRKLLRSYAPNAGQIAWARRVLGAAGDQRGVFELDGKMIDMPVLRHAERIVAMAPQDPTA
jgi:citrate lyase subunit beta/citryl-CoA lyase